MSIGVANYRRQKEDEQECVSLSKVKTTVNRRTSAIGNLHNYNNEEREELGNDKEKNAGENKQNVDL